MEPSTEVGCVLSSAERHLAAVVPTDTKKNDNAVWWHARRWGTVRLSAHAKQDLGWVCARRGAAPLCSRSHLLRAACAACHMRTAYGDWRERTYCTDCLLRRGTRCSLTCGPTRYRIRSWLEPMYLGKKNASAVVPPAQAEKRTYREPTCSTVAPPW